MYEIEGIEICQLCKFHKPINDMDKKYKLCWACKYKTRIYDKSLIEEFKRF